jgi:hypothetical protein
MSISKIPIARSSGFSAPQIASSCASFSISSSTECEWHWSERGAIGQPAYHHSFDTTSFSDIDATVAAIMMTATAVRPTT